MSVVLPEGPYDVMICDPPWDYYGNPDKWAAAGKYYSLMTHDQMIKIPVRAMMAEPSIVFMWVTSSSLARGISCLQKWGFYYRGVEFVWVKTKADGTPIGAQGVRPSIVKPLTEFVISGSTEARGRPLRLHNEKIKQTIFSPRLDRHSEKPEAVQDAIDLMYPDARKIELFARRKREGWQAWGNEIE
jgi:N6-adenosine-specific RNA methylase IME4